MEEITVPTEWLFHRADKPVQVSSESSSISSMDPQELKDCNEEQFYHQRTSNSPAKKPAKSNPLEPRLRRIRANNRERRRIQAINDAMEALRKAIPNTNSKRKLTKLELLRLAQDYIRDLSEMLCSNRSTFEEQVANVNFSYPAYTSYFPEACYTN
ncbi:regulation of intestinal epithelial structure maintenance [Desmophyllum pertusum]|uniref:Regulation of intestinal epithelial structure maintenance n=1 Tax=Desmophyllum pertusum TaxID=174260 RepID=A0A9X0A0I5_9CNID|nr:regulation of intestinal epithelial structure maintenance [Desmophyllum pertusum]